MVLISPYLNIGNAVLWFAEGEARRRQSSAVAIEKERIAPAGRGIEHRFGHGSFQWYGVSAQPYIGGSVTGTAAPATPPACRQLPRWFLSNRKRLGRERAPTEKAVHPPDAIQVRPQPRIDEFCCVVNGEDFKDTAMVDRIEPLCCPRT